MVRFGRAGLAFVSVDGTAASAAESCASSAANRFSIASMRSPSASTSVRVGTFIAVKNEPIASFIVF
ncbi:MAG: hypothetical protein F4Y54_00730 [Dehalococcoidia bacterium]|nr:hypothetical protein [Dehalococcoidia bacterium]